MGAAHRVGEAHRGKCGEGHRGKKILAEMQDVIAGIIAEADEPICRSSGAAFGLFSPRTEIFFDCTQTFTILH